MSKISGPEITFINEKLMGKNIDKIDRRIKNLKDIFFDKVALGKMDPETVVYEVESYFPIEHDTEGGLFYGITYIHPGTVGNEYFMTKGHFHKIRNRGEFYCTMQGEGMLILMDDKRNTWAEKMFPGSIHYIRGNTAHRTANTGNTILSFSAFWPSDAGHDYTTISEQGFSKILINKDGKPALVDK